MPDSSVEAARYALLRRLAPAIRHRVVGRLHPIGLIAEALEWQAQDKAPNLENIRESLSKINDLARTAMLSFTSQITWLARENGATATLGEAIDDCLALLHTDFELRGFSIENEVRAPDIPISLNAVRNVLTAALIAVTDSAPGPARLSLTADKEKNLLLLSIHMSPAQEVETISSGVPYRRLGWEDVKALANADSVRLSHGGESVEMRFTIEDKGVAGPVVSSLR